MWILLLLVDRPSSPDGYQQTGQGDTKQVFIQNKGPFFSKGLLRAVHVQQNPLDREQSRLHPDREHQFLKSCCCSAGLGQDVIDTVLTAELMLSKLAVKNSLSMLLSCRLGSRCD